MWVKVSILCFGLVVTTSGAEAAVETLTLSGNIGVVFPIAGLAGSATLPPGDVKVGDAVTLTVTFDPKNFYAVGLLANPGEQIYSGNADYSIMAGGTSYKGSVSAGINIANDAGWGAPGQFDYFQMTLGTGRSQFNFGTPSSGGEIDFTLTDYSQKAFSSYAIPDHLSASEFQSMYINMDSFGLPSSGPTLGVIAQVGVDNLIQTGASAAPEPATWLLMILGVGGMGAALRTRRRKVAA